MMLYKGYIETEGKASKMNFKDATSSDLLTLEQAEHCESYGGVLDQNTILIDIDDAKQSDVLLNIVKHENVGCRVIQTNHGKHFYFKNSTVTSCATGTKLACGLTADIKLGSRNSYAILKLNGVKREVVYDTKDEIDTLPNWLLPIKTDVNLYGMDEGDGRNQSLFNYLISLNKLGLSKDEARNCIAIINKYILKTPLPDKEIKSLTRDGAFKNLSKENFYREGENGKASFAHEKFGDFMINIDHVTLLDDKLVIYDEDSGVYKVGDNAIEAEMIEHIPAIKMNQRRETLEYLRRKKGVPVAKMSDAKYIAFNNGILDITDPSNTLLPFSPNIVITNKIPHNFNPNAYSEIGDNVLNKIACKDLKLRLLLEEIIGYTFYRRNELRKAFILVGKRRGGKSTFTDIIRDVVGVENTTSLDVAEIADRFNTVTLDGSLVNIGDDIGDAYISNTGVFKSVVSGGTVKVEQKGKPVYFTKIRTKLVFNANKTPRFKEAGGAIMDRIILVPFNANFDKSDPDYDREISTKLQKEDVLEYMVKLAVDGLRRVLVNGEFTESDSVKSETENYAIMIDPIKNFTKDLNENDFIGKEPKAIFENYKQFCEDEGLKPLRKNNLIDGLCKAFGLATKQKCIGRTTHIIFFKKEI